MRPAERLTRHVAGPIAATWRCAACATPITSAAEAQMHAAENRHTVTAEVLSRVTYTERADRHQEHEPR